tara:strand:- start:204 stop:761 length:558 start_codon:yes stop_codon:yes gene_type:complete
MSKSFIGVYDNALTKKECDILISQFEQSITGPGHIFHNGEMQLRPEYKKCMQLDNAQFSNNSIISNILWTAINNNWNKYLKEYPTSRRGQEKIDDEYSFKKFDGEDDGYKAWHCEAANSSSAKRVLVWSFYLNNAKSGTEMLYHPNIRAKIGRCVFFPAAWTHFHRSVTPNKGLKYYVSGWISYE